MFISHYATGLLLYNFKDDNHATDSERSLFLILVLGTQFVDILWGIFTVFGIEGGLSGGSVEKNYFDIPWSHSLLMMVVWSVLYGVVSQFYYTKRIGQTKNFGLLGAISVFSHWLLDFIVHNDDMLISPFSNATVPSLYLWDFPILAYFLEVIIIMGCWGFYVIKLRSKLGFSNMTKPVIMLVLLLAIHTLGYLPSFNNADPMDSDTITGFFVLAGIIVIGWLMTILHPRVKNPSTTGNK